MFRKNITIKKLLILGALFTSLTLLFIGAATNFFLKDSFKQFQLISLIKSVQNMELQIRKAEKDLLVYEVTNSDFFTTGQSTYLETIKYNLQEIQNHLKTLNQSKTIEQLNFENEIKTCEKLFTQYKSNLDKMVSLLLQKGFKDYGSVGEMREKIHNVESALKQTNNPEYTIAMLMLRRHEKDYLLRKDLKYRDNFNAVYAKLSEQINEKGKEEDKTLIPLLTQYHDIFQKVIAYDILLGLDNQNGMRFQINETIDAVEAKLNNMADTIDKTASKKINRIVLSLFLLIGISSSIIVYILVRTSQHIVRSLSNLRHYITRLGNGELPDEIPIYNDDEIGHMKKSINELTKNLKNTKDFAVAVGNGNFEQEVNVFGNHGDLGSALVEMREKLLQVSEEREKQKKEADERLWANEGFNQIHSVLSANHNNSVDYYYEIISKLIHFIKANQGTLFIAESQDNEIILKQKAAYAFDRKRLNEKKLRIGEGLIGAVAYEKQSQYFTNLPNNYINLTSGLGDATPGYLVIVPCLSENELMAVIELASFYGFEPYQISFIERVANDLAATIRKIKVEETTQELLRKTQIQTHELAEKEEEMRQNMEELKATQEALEVREKELLQNIDDLKNKNQKLVEKQLI
jgi:HAMP domain-containing protein